MMQAYLATRLSDHISTTPEGYLLCKDVVICRTGKQRYRGDELGLDSSEFVDVYRPRSEVFSKRFLASLEGKPITDAHPPQFLDSGNAGYYQKGHIQNVRPGPRLPDGEDSVIADLIVTDEMLIGKIMNGTREVSVGYKYDCDDKGGRFMQRNLLANHLAVVPEGRAGRHVRIYDAQPQEDFEDVCRQFHRADAKVVAEQRSERTATDARTDSDFNHEKLREAERLHSVESGDEEEDYEDEENMSDTITRREALKLTAAIERLCEMLAEKKSSRAEDSMSEEDLLALDADDPLSHLAKIRDVVQTRGTSKDAAAYSNAMRMLRRQRNHQIAAEDVTPVRSRSRSRNTVDDFEATVASFHRQDVKSVGDEQKRREIERKSREAEDGGESFEDTVARHRQRLMSQRLTFKNLK